MGDAELKNKVCVLVGCKNKAVGFCNNCRIPVCNVHGKSMNQFYLCVNCHERTKTLRNNRRF